MTAALALPSLPTEPDPFLLAIREVHRIQDLVETIGREEVLEAHPGLATEWAFEARRSQLPPCDLGWHTWLLLAGRGFGKTRALMSAVHLAVQSGIRRVHIICPTTADYRDVAVEGPAGLFATAPPGVRLTWTESKRKVVWPNGATALLFSGAEPESLRGHQAELVAIDEFARMELMQDVYDMATLGLRTGVYPRMLIATTPRPKPLLKRLLKMPGVSVSHGTTWDNASNLAPTFLAQLKDAWEGRKLALQELEGLVIEDDGDRNLFREPWFKIGDVGVESLESVAVGVDPSGGADIVGIVACALLVDGTYAVLADRSCKGSPAHWSEEALRLHDELDADDLVVEVNYGGAMAEDTIRQTAIRMAERGQRPDAFVRIRSVVAHRGKALRAEPISALYEQGKVTHCHGLGKLEAEMLNFTTGWDRERDGSPNRVDALVWALTKLKSIIVDIPMA